MLDSEVRRTSYFELVALSLPLPSSFVVTPCVRVCSWPVSYTMQCIERCAENNSLRSYIRRWAFIAFCALGFLLLLAFHYDDRHEANQWTHRSDLEVLGNFEEILSSAKEKRKLGYGHMCPTASSCFCQSIEDDKWRKNCYIPSYTVRWTCQGSDTRGPARVCEDTFRDFRHMWVYANRSNHTIAVRGTKWWDDGVIDLPKAIVAHPVGSNVSGWVDCARKHGCTVRALGGKGTNETIFIFL